MNCYEKKGWLRIDVGEACEPPKGYGLAYRDYMRRFYVCYPLGINWVVWFFREAYFRILATPMGTADKWRSEAYQQGWKDAEKFREKFGEGKEKQ